MQNDKYVISEQELGDIGITPQEIDEAGGMEAIAHIVWFFQNSDTHCDTMIDDAIIKAIEKKQQETLLQQSFDGFYDDDAQYDDEEDDNKSNTNKGTIQSNIHHLMVTKPYYHGDTDTQLTVKQIYEKNWGKNPHHALKLLLEAYFLETQDMIPDDDGDKKEILKTIALLRSYIAGKPLPPDAEDEQLIVYARTLYKEFLDSKEDYDNCPMCFLLDDYYEELPEKHRMMAQSLPIAAILRIFADNCFYDSETNLIEDPLPEEINIKNLCDMIEKLAMILKIWQ
jgi:hypothetical protein